jgi:uncharacterized membrane protein (UPF0127 family)
VAELRIRNATRGVDVATRARVAATPWARTVGLLDRASLEEGEALWIEPCSSVHMFGMRFAIDVVFVGADDRVVSVVEDLRPWRATWPVRGARAALELPAGTAARTGTIAGDTLAKEAS